MELPNLENRQTRSDFVFLSLPVACKGGACGGQSVRTGVPSPWEGRVVPGEAEDRRIGSTRTHVAEMSSIFITLA